MATLVVMYIEDVYEDGVPDVHRQHHIGPLTVNDIREYFISQISSQYTHEQRIADFEYMFPNATLPATECKLVSEEGNTIILLDNNATVKHYQETYYFAIV